MKQIRFAKLLLVALMLTIAAVGCRCLPIRHGREVREGWVRVAAAMNDGQLAVLIEMLEARHSGVEAKMLIDLPHPRGANADLRTQLVIGIIAVRDDGIQAVIAAR